MSHFLVLFRHRQEKAFHNEAHAKQNVKPGFPFCQLKSPAGREKKCQKENQNIEVKTPYVSTNHHVSPVYGFS